MWKKDFDNDDALEYPRLMIETFDHEPIASTFELKLDRELSDNHPLKGYNFKAIAMSSENPNEFIFETTHPKFSVIFVYLTWCKENDLKYPYFEKFLGEII